MAEDRVQRKLAAILAADVVGYSRLMEQDETGTLARLKSLRSEVFDPTTKQFDGRIFKNTGDGALAEFGSAVDAVQCAVEIQRALARRNADLPEDARIVLRIGISLGDVIVEGDDLYGNGVNVAARMEGLAEPGAICVSGNVHEHIGNALDVTFEDLGEQSVKNIDRPVRSYRVHLEPVPASAIVRQPDTRPALPDKPSIAVLPFANISGDPEQEYFSDGISEDIITALSRVRQFFVIARNTTFTYKGQAVDVQAVAKDLGVRYVLEGSVRKAANRVRITAQLIDGETGNHIWADRYDRELEDIFAVQHEISETVIGAIEPELSRAEQQRAARKPPESMDAWDLYQRGLWHMWRFSSNDRAESQRFFKQAIEIDPNLSPAYAALAYSHAMFFIIGETDTPIEELNAALEAARKAISIDEQDAIAHWVLGIVYYFRRDFASSIDALSKSMEINPSFAQPRFTMGMVLSSSGQPREGLTSLDEAERLSPRDPLAWVGKMARLNAHYFLEDYEEAAAWGLKAVRDPKSAIWVHAVYAATLARLAEPTKLKPPLQSCSMSIHSFHWCSPSGRRPSTKSVWRNFWTICARPACRIDAPWRTPSLNGWRHQRAKNRM